MSVGRMTRVVVAGLILAAASTVRAEVRIGLVEMQTGGMAISWQDQLRQAAEFAVAKLNAEGGLLGEQVRMIIGDDACDGEQAVALANKFVSEGVVFVAGRLLRRLDPGVAGLCKSRDPRSLACVDQSTLTERGLSNVFRVVGRDDVQGVMAGNYLADHWGDRRIAILRDGTTYVKGLADETRKQLNARGVAEGLYEQVKQGAVDFGDLIDRIEKRGRRCGLLPRSRSGGRSVHPSGAQPRPEVPAGHRRQQRHREFPDDRRRRPWRDAAHVIPRPA